MTKEEILEGNKLISKFMNNQHFPVDYDYYNKLPGVLMYNLSWDWLMPVVEKIEATEAYIVIDGTDCEIFTFKNDNYDFVSSYNIEYTSPSKIEAVYLAVVEYIKWYNKQK